jgi:hypothetical protein
MRQEFEPTFPATETLPELNFKLESLGYRLEHTQYIAQAGDRQPGLGLPDEKGLSEVRAYTAPGCEPLLMLVYSTGEGLPWACLFTPTTEAAVTTGMRPLQPISKDEDGTVRFTPNKIVRALLDTGVLDMNAIGRMDFSREDREQFAQLIGYSVRGFGELPYVREETYIVAMNAADRLRDAEAVTE